MRIGSLFSGAGGLDMAVEAVFGGEVIWQSEVDEAASTVLAHRFPGVPNLGDITKGNLNRFDPVDVICGGFPCQDVSAAGKRAGIKQGTRSGLWSVFADVVDHVRPTWVVIENVRGLLSARAHRNLEPTDGVVGKESDGPVLRAAGAVLGDLADLGYNAQWATVAAADVGAPHRRERVFILAADAERRRGTWFAQPRWDSQANRERRQTVLAGGRGYSGVESAADGLNLLPTPCAQEVGTNPDRYDEWCVELKAKHGNGNGHDRSLSVEAQRIGRRDLLPTPQAFDQVDFIKSPEQIAAQALRPNGGGCRNLREVVVNELPDKNELLSTPQSRDYKGRPSDGFNQANLCRDVALMLNPSAWGKYEPAIRRWEGLTRPAPAATQLNKNGNHRLFSAFSEWMMGWPDGWVTDPDIGISRNDQLRIIGNGVCPQQATAALTWLLQLAEVAA